MVIRPIAFRPTPGRPSSSTGPLPPSGSRPGSSAPSPGPLMSAGIGVGINSSIGGGLLAYSAAPPSRPGSSAPSPLLTATAAGPAVGPPYSRPPSQGFAPGHPLVRDGPRPFGSKQSLQFYLYFSCTFPLLLLTKNIFICKGILN